MNQVHSACTAIRDDQECDAMILQAGSLLSKAMEQLSCSAQVEMTSSECKKLFKDKLFMLLYESFHLVRFRNEMLQQMKAKRQH